jgi:hypothetical protein
LQQSFPSRVQVVRADDTVQLSPAEVQEAVAAWANGLANGLNLPSISSEDAAMPYFTDKPAWDGYGGLLVWAACSDQGLDPARRRGPVTIDNRAEDPALKRYADWTATTQYPQLLLGAEIWLPIPSPSVFTSVDVAGNERMFGNCGKLLSELDHLNGSDVACGHRDSRPLGSRRACSRLGSRSRSNIRLVADAPTGERSRSTPASDHL